MKAIHNAFIRAHLARDDGIFIQLIQKMRTERTLCAARGSISRATLLSTMIAIFFEDVGAPDLCADTWARFSAHVTGPVSATIEAVIECARIAIYTRDWYPIYGARLQWDIQLLSIGAATGNEINFVNDRRRQRIAEIVQIQNDKMTTNYYLFCIAHMPRIFECVSSLTDEYCATETHEYGDSAPTITELRAQLIQYHMRAITSVCVPHIVCALDDVTRCALGLPARDINNRIINDAATRGATILQTWNQLASNVKLVQKIIVLQVIIANRLMIAHDSCDPHIAFFLGPLTSARVTYAYNFARIRRAPDCMIYCTDGAYYLVTEIVGIRAPFILRSVQHVMVTKALRATLSHQIVRECILRYIMNLPGRGYVAGIYILVGSDNTSCIHHIPIISHDVSSVEHTIHSEISSYIAQNKELTKTLITTFITFFTELSRIESIAQARYPLRAIECGGYAHTLFDTYVLRAQSLYNII